MTGVTVPEHLLEEDALSRVRALDHRESFIVEAPAGAGKTELLTQRFLKLLQTVDEPEEIIAITFTNKAASEMRARILDSLQDAAQAVPIDKEHKQQTRALALAALQRSAERDWRLLENPSRLRIYTIDSFSSHLARQMPLMSRFGAQPGVREDATPYYEEAAARMLDLLDDESAGEVIRQTLRYFDNDAGRLGRLLTDMLARRDQWQEYTQHGTTPEAAAAALGRMMQQDIEAAAAVLTPARQQALMPLARYAASNLPCEHPIALLRDWDTEIPARPEALPMWRAVCDLLLTGKDHTGVLRKRLDKNMGMPATAEAKPFKEQLTAILDELRELPEAEVALAGLRLLPDVRSEDEAWQIIATLGHLLNFAAAQLWLVFQSHGEVDFVEVAQRALRALRDEDGNPTELALKLDYRIQHLLVDEFQDTSPTQVRLLEQLTSGWSPGDGRTLFAVGDPMQSIYRFRKADVGLFLHVAENGIGDIRLVRLRLWRNNRSCAPVIDWINRTFASVFPQQDNERRGAISYRPFVATKPTEAGSAVQVHPLVVAAADTDEEESASSTLENLRLQEANRIIEIIHHARAEDPDSRIAVLVRARSHLQALVSQIRRHHPSLPFQAVEIDELANRQIVQDLLSLTCALHHRADRVHWLAILRAPWCGLTLADLHALVGGDCYRTVFQFMHDDARIAALSEDGRARLLHVRRVLDEALAQRGRQSIARWVHGVWLMLGGADCLWEPGDVRDVQAFFDLVARLEAGGRFSVEQLATEVQKLYAAPDSAPNADKLQFMTIHKSKGLEFDTVILPGLDRGTGGSDQQLLMWEEVRREDVVHDAGHFDLVAAPLPSKEMQKSSAPTPYDYLRHLERVRGNNEDARVLYVAATRAERCLHLIGIARRDAQGELKAPRNTFLELLWPHVRAEFEAAATRMEPADMQEQEGVSYAEFVPRLVRLATPAMPDVFRRRDGDATLTRHAGQGEMAQTGEGNLDALIGILAHRYLEFVVRQGVQQWPVSRFAELKPAMRKWLQRQGVATDQLEAAAERTIVMLQLTLQSEDGRWLLKPRPGASAELPIASLEEDSARTKRLDLTFVEDGVRWIVDYKSTALAPDVDAQTLRRQAETHRPQLDGYARLFDAEGMPVRLAVLFLSVGRLVVLD